MDVRFTPVRFGTGYDQSEVDDFLDRCDRALASGDGSMSVQAVLEVGSDVGLGLADHGVSVVQVS